MIETPTQGPTPPPAGRSLRIAGLVLLTGLSVGISLMTGGMAGPLAALVLLPTAAALWTAEPAGSDGAVLSLAALGAVVFGRSLGWAGEPPPGWLSPLLTLGALGAVLALLGLGLPRLRSSDVRTGATDADPVRRELERLLADGPGLLLALEEDGRVRAAFGDASLAAQPHRLFETGLDALSPADSASLSQALAEALRTGQAERAYGRPPRRLRLRRSGSGGVIARVDDASAEAAVAAEVVAERDAAVSASAAKSRFLADMSHELRTPLNAVIGFSDVMRQRLFGPLGERYGEYAGNIHAAGLHLLDLINDLLDVSKIEADKYQLHRETLDARDPVQAALRLLRTAADEAGMDLRADLPQALTTAELDRRAVRQITLNLVSNALKFTPRGGRVTVTLASDGADVELAVADSGVGIAPEDLERLGRPYEQAGDAESRARGTGLGLSLVRALAALHGGAFVLESVQGEGTVATVRLPVRPATGA